MRKVWHVAKHEYLTRVRRRSFLIGTLAVPLLIVVVMAISILVSIGGSDTRPVGYVDRAGVLSPEVQISTAGEERSIAFRAFEDQDAARAALESGDIQAFFVLSSDYPQSGEMSLYYWEDAPGEVVWEQWDDFVRANLVSDLAPSVRQRALEGPSLTVRSADGRREFNSKNWMNFVLPIAVGIFFMIAVMSSSGYLLQAVTTEKENRTIEVMITSLSPEQLVGGKALGLMAVSLTQIGIWALAVVVGLIVGAQFLEPLRRASVPWQMLGITVLYFFPAYALVAGLMVAIGSAVTETRQGQQIAGILNLMFSAPFFFVALIIANPNSPVLVALTLFPTTAFVMIVMRWSLALVPLWQMVLSWVLLIISAGLSVWAAARILRVGMLSYGQRLSLRAVWRAVRAGVER
jgi:ABC-2 type transport system permease protein